MVGVPKSKGCSTCRTRSIKCDEARPSCSQCRRGGRKCPGYQTRAKFVDEGTRLEAKASRKVKGVSTRKQPKLSVTSVKEQNSACRDRFLVKREAAPKASMLYSKPAKQRISAYKCGFSDTLKLTGFRPDLRCIEQEGIVASFIQDLFPSGRVTVQYSFIGSWLWRVPEALHRNHAMDLAAESLAVAYYAKKANSAQALIRSRKLYGFALRMLSIALQDQCSRFSSETLCATLLLVHYENFIAMRGESWVTHAGGTSRLIQLRGPDRHRTGFECAMFMASRPYLISQAVMAGTSCFLDDDDWRSIQIEDGSSPLMPHNSSAYHDGLNHFARMPGLLQKFKHLRDGDGQLRSASIYREAKQIRTSMTAWFEKLNQDSKELIRILLQSPPESQTPFPAVYEYKDIITATFVVNYSAYLIQINNVLGSLDGSKDHLPESVMLSKEICMSASYCARGGFCGIQAMAFVLPLAISALPEQYRDWTQLQINFFEKVKESYTLRSTILDDVPVVGG